MNAVDPSGAFLAVPWHFGLTFVASMATGHSVTKSFVYAAQAVKADFGTQSSSAVFTAQHGMAGFDYAIGRWQSRDEAIQSNASLVQTNMTPDRLGYAAHAVQDPFAWGHEFKIWEGLGNTSFLDILKHVLSDAFPSPSRISAAYEATVDMFDEADASDTIENDVSICAIDAEQAMKSRKVFQIFRFWVTGVLGLTIIAAASISEERDADPLSKWESLAHDHAYVTQSSVSAPLGRFILIRYRGSFCAIRFSDMRRGRDEKAPSAFSSGEENLYAIAEQSQIVQTSNGWRVVSSRVISLKRGPIVGLGHLGVQKGNSRLVCDGAKLEWAYPNNVSLGLFTESKDLRQQVDLAPTAWSQITEIDLGDPRLHWYHYDEARPDTLIALESLPPSI